MANNIAFQPMGKTVKILCNAVTANTASVTADSPVQQYMLTNHSAQPVYIWLSPSSNPVTVSLPVVGTPGYAIIVAPNSCKIVTGPQCSSTLTVQASAISENNGPEIYITPGEGL